MEACAARCGSVIEEAFVRRIEALISAEKPQGTDFCVGAIDATCQNEVDPGHHHSVWRRKLPVGPHCPAGMDLVKFSLPWPKIYLLTWCR